MIPSIIAAPTPTRASVRPSLLLDFANSKTLDPRITFSRGSTAAYYDGQTTALAEQNLITYSQQIGGTNWTIIQGAAALNNAIAPDGTMTATTYTVAGQYGNPSGSGVAPVIYCQPLTTYTISAYVQWVSGNTAMSQSFATAPANTTLSQPITITSTWTRFSYTFTTAAGQTNFSAIGFCQDRNASGWGSFNIWGAQVEQHTSATAYNPTTTTPINNYIPVLMFAASNVPRFDTNPATNESLGLLIEQGSTNLLTYSQTFSGWNQAASGGTLRQAAAIAPDGTLTACQFVDDTTNVYRRQQLNVSGSFAAGTSLTASLYVKMVSYSTHSLSITDYTNTSVSQTIFNISNGSITTAGTSSGNVLYVGSSITPVGDGWYRISISVTLGAASSSLVLFQDLMQNSMPYAGNGYNSTLVWGAQLEALPFATSYIPTTSAAVTRSADNATITGTNFSSWYNQSQGTLYSDYSFTGSGTNGVVSFQPRTAGSYAAINGGGGGNTGWYISGLGIGAAAANTNNKQSISYTVPYNFSGDLNGATTVSSAASDYAGTSTSLSIGFNGASAYLNGHIKRIAYYPVALPSTQLQGITAQ